MTSTNENGDTSRISYDQRNLQTKTVSPFMAGHDLTSTVTYDQVGNVAAVVSPRASDAQPGPGVPADFVTGYVYDPDNRVVRVDLPTGAGAGAAYMHRAYDPNGRLAWASVAVGTGTASQVTADQKTEMTYWDPGWIRSSKDPANPVVSFDYNARGQQTSRQTSNQGSAGWVFWPDGMLRSRSNPAGSPASFSYDPDGNLVGASATPSEPTLSPDEPVDIEARYDSLDRPSLVRHQLRGELTWTVSSSAYDLNSNVVSRTQNRAENTAGAELSRGRISLFAYDKADELVEMTDTATTDADRSDDQHATYQYRPTGWEARRQVDKWSGSGWTPTQIVTTDHFANGLIHTQDTSNGTTRTELHDLSYVDGAGVFQNANRTTDTFTRATPDANSPCDVTNCSVAYVYDGRDRLASTTETTGTAQTKTDYTLDTAGNVITETVNGQMVRAFRYVGNQLTEIVTPAGVTAAKYFYTPLGATDCVTDAQGSPDTCKSFSPPDPHLIKKYRYDDLDRLRAAYTYAGTTTDTATYDYDPIDRLLIQSETHTGELTRTTSFDYLGLSTQVSQETQKNPAGAVLSTKAYSYDPFGRRISMLTDTAQSRLTYGYDTHGSVTQLIDQAGKVRAAYGYTAYGDKNPSLTRGDTNPTNPLNPYRFTHQRLDPGAGNLAMGNRRFGPDIGRFLQRDSYYGATANLGLSLDPLTQNRYSFAGGNPVSYIDSNGHEPYDPNDPTDYKNQSPPSDLELEDKSAPAEPEPSLGTKFKHNLGEFAGGFAHGAWELAGQGGLRGPGVHQRKSHEGAKVIEDAVDHPSHIPGILAAPFVNCYNSATSNDARGMGQCTFDMSLLAATSGAGRAAKATEGAAATAEGARTVVNLGGEGEVAGAVNVQPARIGGNIDAAFENAQRVAVQSEQPVVMAEGSHLPFRTGSVDQVWTNNVPVGKGSGYFGPNFDPAEILRILRRGGSWLGNSAP